VFGVGAFAYLIGVMQRSSLGVAGVDATERFEVQAALLSSLAVVQIIVYAGLQIPVGVLVDRVGPKALVATGAALMAVGQFTLAIAPDISIAIVGRILVGAGDAMTFISLQRILVSWFSGRKLPVLSQVLGTTGALGQVLSAIPLSILLHSAGWQPAFLSASAASVLAFVVVVIFLANQPRGAAPTSPIVIHPAMRTLRESLARPGTQLGFWSHFVTQSSGTVFSLLWGFPFLSIGLGYGAAGASALLTFIVAIGVISGPILGILTARFPHRRSNIVLGIVVALAITWGIVLLWPGVPPLAAVLLLLIVIAVGGPGSVIGFDFARTFNPKRSLGSATGFVNVGGFLASFIMMFLIGLVLDAIDSANGGSGVPSELYSFDSFRLAFAVQYVIVGIGVVFLIGARRRTRSLLAKDEGITVAPLWVALVRKWRKNDGSA
jgi:sugar phosphate permease